MKLNTQYSENDVDVLGIEKSQNFGFSKDAQEMVFTMFTKNIYSNPIGSVVREITSNCFDSHKEAGVHEPVIIKLTKENAETYISFTDNGVGISRERMTSVYAQYFNSTKRNDNNQIGGFGIGGKTPLAYTESFFLITRYNGTQYTYTIRKGKASPVLDLLDKVKTTERNGTTIKIPVKGSDVSTFEREIVRQLYYFENVIFEGFSTQVKNDYTIIEGKHFLYRGHDYNSNTHICLGRVAYPIDYNVFDDDDVDSDDWYVPIAIKLDIGEINVSASRESIEYNDTTKKLIKRKMELAKEELLTLLQKQHEKLNTLEEFYQLENNPNLLILNEKSGIDISSITRNSRYAKPVLKKLNTLSIPTQSDVIHMFYNVSLIGKLRKRKDSGWDKSVRDIKDQKVYFLSNNEEIPRKKNAYMKHQLNFFYAIRRKNYTIGEIKALIRKITPDRSTTSTKLIFQQFRELQKDVYNLVEGKTKKYASITVPEGFTVSQSKYNPKFELPIAFVGRNGWDRERYMLSDLDNGKSIFYYGTSDDEYYIKEYDNLYKKLFQHSTKKQFGIKYGEYNLPIHFVMIAKSNVKYVSELKNFKPVRTATKLFQRKRESVLKYIEMKNFMTTYNELSNLFLNKNLFIEIDPAYGKVIDELNRIKKQYEMVHKYDVYFSEGSTLLYVLNIDLKKIKINGTKQIAIIREKTEKNGMLQHVNIHNDFNPSNNYYSPKEIGDIMQLLKLAYVK
jgi:hypothetical protein